MIHHPAIFGPRGIADGALLRSAGTADHHGSSCLYGGRDETRSVLIDAGHGHKNVASRHGARIRTHFHAATTACLQQSRKIPLHVYLSDSQRI